MEKSKAFRLAEEYIRSTDRHVFLTGKAGTGKTTFLKYIRKSCGKRMIVTAPTGIAAMNAGGVTLHSFFQLPFSPYIPGSDFSRSGFHRMSKVKRNIITSLDLLIIDEISMVRADMLDAVDLVLRRYRRNSAPFGGVQVLMVGDLQQLAPVVTDKDQLILEQYYANPYYFSSKVLEKTELIGIELDKIYRQEDTRFIQLLNAVRENKGAEAAISALNQRVQADLDTAQYSDYITLCTHNRQADQINQSHLASLPVKATSFSAVIEGEFPEHLYPAAQTLTLKKGCQVMFLRNDSSQEKKYYNGKTGRICRIKDRVIEVMCPGETTPVVVEPVKWENIKYSLDPQSGDISEKVIGSFSQYPLRLAWAVTIHKSQGLTFDKVIIDAQAAFSHGQVYVALSRCRTLEGIVLSSPLKEQSIKSDPDIAHFNKVLRESQEKYSNLLTEEKYRYQQRLLLECFNFQELDRKLTYLTGQLRRYQHQVQLFGTGELELLQTNIRREICLVGQNFGRQLSGLFREKYLPGEDPVILERLVRAVTYFEEKLESLFVAPMEKFQVETDNKEIGKQINRQHDFVVLEGKIKAAAIASCKEGFTPDRYLRAISQAEIEHNAGTKRKTKKGERVYTESDIEHPELFQQIRTWRSNKAKELGVPLYTILHQKTLVQVVVRLPATVRELKTIKGIGAVTAERYGEELVAMVTEYRGKHGISKVQLPILDEARLSRQKMEKTKNTKEISLEYFQQGMSIMEIAAKREMKAQTIERHLAHWIGAGVISIDQLISNEKREVIEGVFAETGTDFLKKAKEILGDDYSYGELELVRAHIRQG